MDELEPLMAKIIDLMSKHYDKRAILRGGMAIRLMGVPRYTNDLDYLIIPHKSKKELIPEITDLFKTIEGATVKHSFNSKCLRILVTVGHITIQVEAKVALQSKSSAISNEELAVPNGFPIRLIPIQDTSIALSNKMAAWNERRLSRDLYDIYFFLQLGVTPDIELLQERLSEPQYTTLVKHTDYFKGKSFSDYIEFMLHTIKKTDEAELENDLLSILPDNRVRGIRKKLLVKMNDLI
jgi:predicted nucleotidyltransferase component of viral defense system